MNVRAPATGTWTVDTRRMVAEVPGFGRSRAAFVNTDAGQPPTLTIEPGRTATLDLYFPTPAKVESGAPPRFDLAWQVDTPSGPFTETTPFDRVAIPEAVWGYGYGDYRLLGYPYWWYDPFFFSYTFVPQPTFVATRFVDGHDEVVVPRVAVPSRATHVATPVSAHGERIQ
jgi:hypothetical protein